MNDDAGLPAQAFPAGEYLRDEIEARGWTVAEFAQILGRPTQAVSEILNGHKEITAETAMEIAAATDTEAATWLRLQNTYRLWKLSRTAGSERTAVVSRRARLAQLVPMPELRQRGIVPTGAGIDEEEAAVCEFLGIDDPMSTPVIEFAARRSDEGRPISPAQLAWISCVRRTVRLNPSEVAPLGDVRKLAGEVVRHARVPSALAALPDLFRQYGIRLVYVAPFKSGKIDGGAYLGKSGTPVVALSGRIQRIDSVVFTLLHELAHVHLGHLSGGIALDSDVCAATQNETEHAADKLAMEWALPGRLEFSTPISKRAVTD
ncbi:HigA family addiction module antitoxin, partial [Nocardia sp. NPDC058497]|uniref:HigA family addiction module antitoxin n=1 Tax=Nocardia sp. NPDC058497 TaxID=3346529 RepID=UPI003653CA31